MEQPNEVRSKALLLFWCLNANIGAFISGIFFTAFNACIYQVLVALQTSSEKQNLIIASLSAVIPLGGIGGGIVFSLLAAKVGRRRLLIAIDIITIISCTISQSSLYLLMLLGRMLCGFVCGANFMMVPLYVREMLPQHFSKNTSVLFRGMFTLGACFSFFVGYFSQKPPAEPNNVWMVVFMIPILFAVIRMVLLTFVAKLDTPTFYIKSGDSDNAWKVINKIYTDNCLDSAYRRERRYSTHFKFADIFSHEYRGQVRLALLLVIFTQLMGGNLLNFYSTLTFFAKRTGITEQDYSDVGFLNLFTAFVAFFSSVFGHIMLDKFGKRPLLVYGAFSLFGLSFMITFSELVSFVVGQATLVILFAAVQNMSFNLVSSALVYELLPSYSIVLQVVCEMLGMLGSVFVFPLIAIELNFVITGIMSLIGFFVVFKMVKETKGMTSDEIHRLFQSQTKGLLDDEVAISPSKLEAGDDFHETLSGDRVGLSQSRERQLPVY